MKNKFQYLAALIIMSSLHMFTQAQSVTLHEMRSMYITSVEDKGSAEKFYNRMFALKELDAISLAYQGAAAALMSKHVFNPMAKIEYLKITDLKFKDAVKKDASNPEIRFLRYSYQHYVPRFLGYSNDLDSDKSVMITQIRSRTNELRKDELLFTTMIKFLLESRRCLAAEDTYLRGLLGS